MKYLLAVSIILNVHFMFTMPVYELAYNKVLCKNGYLFTYAYIEYINIPYGAICTGDDNEP